MGKAGKYNLQLSNLYFNASKMYKLYWPGSFGTHNWLEAGLVPITRKLVISILEVLIVFFLHITVTKFEPVVF
jgi:hypothetical protein